MVCFCHFGEALRDGHFFTQLFYYFEIYGKYGVHVFFVISGFVIPLSLFRGKYTLKNYPKFLLKRFLRLHPPYLAALFLTLAIMFLSYRVRHEAFPESGYSIFQSLFYIHAPADNPVFWTLLVEAQYYFFIGIFYILMMQFPRISLLVLVPLLLLLSHSFIADYVKFCQYIVFFLVGTIGFFIYTKNGNFYINYFVLLSLFVYIFFINDIPALVTSFFTLLAILTVKRNIPALIQFPGIISYSIYLIHFPIGIKLINFFRPKINPDYNWLLFIMTTILCVLISWAFYLVFESYSEKLSKKIKYT